MTVSSRRIKTSSITWEKCTYANARQKQQANQTPSYGLCNGVRIPQQKTLALLQPVTLRLADDLQCSQTRFFHALFDAPPPRQICHNKTSLLQNCLHGFHDLVKAARCTSLLREPDDAVIASAPSLEDSEKMRVEVDRFQVQI